MTIKSKKFKKGIRLESTTSPATEDGEIRNDSTNPASHRLKVKLEGELEQEIVTADQAQTLSNKTIDSASNIITVDADEATVENLEVANLKAGVLETDLNNPVDDTKLPSAQAVKSYVAQEVATKDEASEISYSNVTSGLTATNVQAAIDEVEARLDTAEADVVTAQSTADNHIADATDAHAASAITNTPSGNLIATDVQSALNELQSDVDGRALDSALQDHINDATDAHDATAVSYDNTTSGLTATEVQAAIDEVEGRLDTAESNITAADSALSDHLTDTEDAHDASAISVVPAGNLESTEVQAALEELQSDIDTRALDSDLTTHVSATAAHGTTGDVVGTSDTQTLTNKTIDGATITAPAQLDVKQDTLANLTTYATTATNGQIVFATDTKQMFQVIDASLTAIGGGGGGTSFDENQVAHGLAVLDAIYHNGTSWVKAQANDAATLATHIVSAVVDADNFTAQNFGRFEATSHGKTVGEFYFLSESVAGGSDTVEGSVYSAPLYYVEDANTIHALVYRPSLRPQNTQFREDVDVLENILAFDTTSAGFSTETTINGESFRLTHDASVTRFAEVDLTVTPKFRDKILELPVDLKSTATSGNFKVIITDQTNSKTLADEVLQPQSGSETVKRVVSFSTKPADGDLAIATIRVRFEALAESGAVSDFDDVLVQLKKTQSLEVIAIEQEENVFSARIANNGTTASITSQSSPFIESVSRTSTGVVQVNFKSGLFSVAPSVFVETLMAPSPNAPVSAAYEVAPTTSSVTIRTTQSTSNLDRDFDIIVQRQGSDYRNLERRIEREVSTFKEVLVEEADSMVELNTRGSGASGYGSVNTAIARFTTLVKSIGSDIEYLDSPTEGAKFIIKSSGVYDISYTGAFDTAGQLIGISRNSTQLTTNINGIAKGDRLAATIAISPGDDVNCSWSGYLEAGDIIRPHDLGGASVTVRNDRNHFTITKQGSLKKASVAPDSKIKIPTSELRMEGSSSKGSTDTAVVKFDSIASIRGDAFSIVNNTTNGTVVTILKDGNLNITCSLYDTAASVIFITKNLEDLTNTTPVASKILAMDGNQGPNEAAGVSWSGSVIKGDVIRIVSQQTPNAYSGNILSLYHQEQDISVAVSNVTPQFEDADSMVRLHTFGGYGSVNTKIVRFASLIENLGSAITYTDSATDGASFTVEEDGFYSVSFSMYAETQQWVGISLNSDQLTTSIYLINPENRLAEDAESGQACNPSWSGFLRKGDVVRPHTGGLVPTDTSRTVFTIAKVGVPSIAEVDVTPFVNLDQYRTKYHSVRAEGNGGESISTGVTPIPFSLVDDTSGAWNGSQYTVQENESIVFINFCIVFTTTASREIRIYKNGSAYRQVNQASSSNPVAGTFVSSKGEFVKGDVLELRSFVNGGTLLDNSTLHGLQINEEYEEEGRSKFHSIAQTENEFSARIANNGTTASISSESQNFIQTAVRHSLGRIDVTFIPGFFTEVPSVVVSRSQNGTLGLASSIENLTNSGFTVYTAQDGVSLVDVGINLHVSRQGADRKDLQKAIVQLSDFPRVNRTLTQEITHNAAHSTLLDRAGEIRYNSSNFASNGSNLIVVEDDAANTRTKFVAQRDCTINVSLAHDVTAQGSTITILRDSDQFQMATAQSYSSSFLHTSARMDLKAGDFFTVQVFTGQLENNANQCQLLIYAEAQELERISNVEADGEYYYVPANTNDFWDGLTAPEYNWDTSLLTSAAGSPAITSSNLLTLDETTDPTQTRIVAKKRIELDLSIFGSNTNTGAAAIFIFNSSGERISQQANADVNYIQQATASLILEKDDYVYVGVIGNGFSIRVGGISLKAKPSLSSVVVGLNPNTIEEKFLSANVTTTGDIADLTFNNLEVGKWYHLTGQFSNSVNNQTNLLRFRSGASGTGDLFGKLTTSTSAGNTPCSAVSLKFKATSTNLYANLAAADGTVFGDGTKEQTFLQLEKLSNTEG